MAGHGPTAKQPEQRASQKVPQRGEWITLPPLERPVLPGLPRRERGDGPWSLRTRRVWDAWRKSWVTGIYGDAEISMAVELAYVYEDAVRDSKPTRWAEVRQWMDRLGLTLKGQRDLRLRLTEDASPAKRSTAAAISSVLRLVDDDAAATA